MICERYVNGRARSNAYLYAPDVGEEGGASGGACVVIDPGVGASPKLARRIEELGLEPVGVVLTHGHPDHTWTSKAFASRFEVPVWLHPADHAWFSDPASGGALPLIRLGGRLLTAIRSFRPAQLRPLTDETELPLGLVSVHTPGHTRGSACVRAEGIVFTGDTLFASGPGHTGYPGGSRSALRGSVRDRLLGLPDDVRLMPGHGPDTQMARVRPVLERFVNRG